VDVNAILKTHYFGHGTPWRPSVDKGAARLRPSVQPYPYDPNKAKALLAEAGFPNGFEVEFDSFTGRSPTIQAGRGDRRLPGRRSASR